MQRTLLRTSPGHLRRVAAVLMAVALTAGFSLVATPVTAREPVSATTECTLVGATGNDRLIGTPGNDAICALTGNDPFLVGGSDDTVVAGTGRDSVDAGAGRDSVAGGLGDDQLIGGAGGDRIAATVGDVCALDQSDQVLGRCGSDAAAPLLIEVTAPPVVSAGSTLAVTWRVVDRSGVDRSGAITGPGTWMTIGGPPGFVRWCEPNIAGTLVTGSAFDGVYRAVCPVPPDAVNETYSLWIAAVDVFGNRAESAGVVSFAVTAGSSDNAPPVVSELGIAAPVVAPGDQVTFQWRATDSTGVAGVIPWAFGPNGRLTDPTGALWLSYTTGVLVAGDARDGTYQATVQLSPTAVPGSYTVWVSRLDTLGNRSYEIYAPGGVPLTFTVA